MKRQTRNILIAAAAAVLVIALLVLLFAVGSGEATGKVKCTVTIECTNLSEDMSKLTNEDKKDQVPDDGIILADTEYSMDEGSTAYELLGYACRDNGIQMDSSYSSSFDSQFVEGIGNIYGTDAGDMSGWLYLVNGEMPDDSCSDHVLTDGDAVTWSYTCDGGSDVMP